MTYRHTVVIHTWLLGKSFFENKSGKVVILKRTVTVFIGNNKIWILKNKIRTSEKILSATESMAASQIFKKRPEKNSQIN